jgi:hypothetical protein
VTKEKTMSNALTLRTDEPQHLAKASHAFEPGSYGEAMEMAKTLVESRMFANVRTPEAAFAIIATGRELGFSMMQSLRGIHIIEGKPTLSADAMAGLVKSRPEVCTYFRCVETTDKVAVYETQRAGDPPTRMQFTIEDAQRAGATSKDNWKKYPAAMLRARAITALARAVYPDLLMGLYDPDELERAVRAAPAAVVVQERAPVADAVIELSDEEVGRILGVYYECVEAAGNVGDLMKVYDEAGRDDRLSASHRSLVKAALSARRAVLEGSQAAAQ